MAESEIGDLIIEIRSATAGVGGFTYKFDHMAELTGPHRRPDHRGEEGCGVEVAPISPQRGERETAVTICKP